MAVLFYILVFLFLILCGLLCLVILVQESKTMGLGASFGGDVSTSMFGTSTADVLKKFTAILGAAFFISCFVLSLWTSALARSHQSAPQVTIESV
ncbi:MAG: preprotein translocase subunit SecG [Chlamydiae bacterium]|nr:preprotein translocase subunit SecG [Chlamydiota bacterium]